MERAAGSPDRRRRHRRLQGAGAGAAAAARRASACAPILTRGGRRVRHPAVACRRSPRTRSTPTSSRSPTSRRWATSSSRRSADLVVVAPATADLMAKAANGLANDLASTTLLATDKPVLMAPAMNVRMWEHPATRRNLRDAAGRRRAVRRPRRGRRWPAASSATAAWPSRRRSSTPSMAALAGPAARPLAGRRALVTAGPTARADRPGARASPTAPAASRATPSPRRWRALGAEVTLVSGPTALPAPAGVDASSTWRPPQEMLARLRGGAAGRHRRLRGGGGRLAARRPPAPPRSRRAAAPADARASSRTPTSWPTLARPGPSGRSWWSASRPRPTTWRPTPSAKLDAQGLRLDRRQRRLRRRGGGRRRQRRRWSPRPASSDGPRLEGRSRPQTGGEDRRSARGLGFVATEHKPLSRPPWLELSVAISGFDGGPRLFYICSSTAVEASRAARRRPDRTPEPRTAASPSATCRWT